MCCSCLAVARPRAALLLLRPSCRHSLASQTCQSSSGSSFLPFALSGLTFGLTSGRRRAGRRTGSGRASGKGRCFDSPTLGKHRRASVLERPVVPWPSQGKEAGCRDGRAADLCSKRRDLHLQSLHVLLLLLRIRRDVTALPEIIARRLADDLQTEQARNGGTSRHITSHHSRYTTHVTSHHITASHVTSRHVTSRHVTSRSVTLHYVKSHHTTPHHVTPLRVTSRHVTSRHATLHREGSEHVQWLCV